MKKKQQQPAIALHADLRARLRAVAAVERTTESAIAAEALYIHLHHLESRPKPRQRFKAVCPSCGTIDITNATHRLEARKKKHADH